MQDNLLEFGVKRENEERRDGGFAIVFDPSTQKYVCYKHPKGDTLCFFGGGFNEGENEIDGSVRELTEESGLSDFILVEKLGNAFVHYFNNNKQIPRCAYITSILVVLKNLDKVNKKLENHEREFESILAQKDEILESMISCNHNKDYDHWIYFLKKAEERLKDLGYV